MNAPLTISMVTNEALFILKNSLTLGRHVDRSYDKSFAQSGAKIGTTLNVRMPVQYTVGNGPVITPQDFVENQASLVLNQQPNVAMTFSSTELLLSIDEFSKRVLSPAVVAIANSIDFNIASLYKLIWNFVGVVGTSPATSNVPLNAGVQLDNNSVPRSPRYIVVNPGMNATLVPALQGLFNPQTKISSQYESGMLAQAVLGFDWDQDQNINFHTVGALGGTPVIAAASATTGTSITLSGLTGGVSKYFRDGDIITIANVYQVNVQSRQTTNVLQQFRVVGDTDSDATGNATVVTISPAITPAGQYQTTDSAAVAGAAINVFGVAQAGQGALAGTVTPQALAFHRDCFTLASADLPVPNNVEYGARAADPDLGLSIRILRDYNIMSDQWPCRVDVLYGCTSLRPQLGCRIVG
jgi:hypothetical protein